MSQSVGKYIELLCSKHKVSQSAVARGINVPRQLLSYVMCDKRELSLQLAMEHEAFFSLPEGELMKMLNIMIAMYYFGIQNPEKYLARIEREHINKLLKHATGVDS